MPGKSRGLGLPQRALSHRGSKNRNRKFSIFAIHLLPRIKTVADPLEASHFLRVFCLAGEGQTTFQTKPNKIQKFLLNEHQVTSTWPSAQVIAENLAANQDYLWIEGYQEHSPTPRSLFTYALFTNGCVRSSRRGRRLP